MTWVYVIERAGALLYIGSSNSPGSRLGAHRRRFGDRSLTLRLVASFADRHSAYVFEQRCIRSVVAVAPSLSNVMGRN